ncbi:GNAT family N-acetyltransferase [Plantactinospora sp. CA-290183]|uniref:GNAT family N-acetyltransferase n=1 Tax=Plantactinospora sp. CA-290183 TaxID=3240006 RepID=UPI003D8A8B90
MSMVREMDPSNREPLDREPLDREPLDLGLLLRALRRRADLSQRQLAVRAGVPKSTVSRIEAGGAADPRFRTVERLILAAGGTFDLGGLPSVPHEECRDEGGRHYPAHLDVREVRTAKDWSGAWWAHWYTVPPERWPVRVPAETFDLCRERRDRRRWRAEVRARVRLRAVTEAVPAGGWQWVAELPAGELVGELRAHLRGPHPTDIGYPDGGWDDDPPEADPEPEVVLDGVLVADGCRGLGIGRRLLAELLAEMDRNGVTVARAVTDFDGAGFLLRCGFQPEASRPLKLTLRRAR